MALRIAITGASGLVGTRLTTVLEAGGHTVIRLVRDEARRGPKSLFWDPEQRRSDSLAGFDAAIHLAGESIAGGRWTARRKQRIRDSRVQGTSFLAETLARLSQPPRLLISASAIGYYGDRGDEILTEASPPGSGFLPEVCVAWEAAAEPARAAGIRVVHPRIGIVLAREGGALATMRRVFRLGLGASFGSGRQYMSWITLDDLVRIFERCLDDKTLGGPVNAVAPTPVTNAEFTRALARVLHRPSLPAIPAGIVKLIFGDLGREGLLASARVIPARLQAEGFHFESQELDAALRRVLSG